MCQGRYPRLDQLQSDLLSLLREARKEGSTDSQVWTYQLCVCVCFIFLYTAVQVYADSVSLEKHYLIVRDMACKNGELLWSPALTYTTRLVLTSAVALIGMCSVCVEGG